MDNPGDAARPLIVVSDLGTPRRCYEKGCPANGVVSCDFVDRHGRGCLTSWCPPHRFTVGEQTFCRRHASIVRALGTAEHHPPLPELDNRAPSLVDWVSTGIDRQVQALIEDLAAARDGEELAVEPVHLVVGTRGRRWGRSWTLRNAEGHDTLRVSVEVDEHSDPEIAVRIDGNVITRSIAPWIGHRLRGEWVPANIDVEERKTFYADLVTLIAQGIEEALAEPEPPVAGHG